MEKLSVSQIARNFLYQECSKTADYVIGRVLTITDAAAKDEVQRKALKDLIQATVWNSMHTLEAGIGYFCEDLGDKLGEERITPVASLTSEAKRVNIFE